MFLTATSIRLVGPLSANGTGRVEIFFKGQWRAICSDRYWDVDDAKVACRELGFKYTIRALPREEVPNGGGQIWLSKVHCYGREQNLSCCSHDQLGDNSCNYGEAGVQCSSAGK